MKLTRQLLWSVRYELLLAVGIIMSGCEQGEISTTGAVTVANTNQSAAAQTNNPGPWLGYTECIIPRIAECPRCKCLSANCGKHLLDRLKEAQELLSESCAGRYAEWQMRRDAWLKGGGL